MTNDLSNTQFKDAEKLVKAQQFPAALQILNPLIKAVPDHQGALYLKAVCHRYLQDLSQAVDTLLTLQTYHPDYGRTYQELGHCYRAQAKFAEAISAYQQAVQLHPGLIASWQQLAQLFTQINEPKLVQEAQDKVQEIQSLPKYLLAAQSAFYEGRLGKAENLTREFLQKNPSHVPGMRLLAKIAVKLNILEDAQILLENANVIAPHSTDLKLELIQVLQQRQLFTQAHELARETYHQYPDHPLTELAYANQCVAIGCTDIAITHFTHVLSELSSHAAVYVQRGHAYKTIGEPDKAIADYVKASELKPDFGDAYWSLANLKTFVFTNEQINTMKAMLGRPGIQLTDKYHICFALGKAFEDHQDYAQAFSYYEQGNTLKHQQLRYDPDETTQQLQAQIQYCPPELFANIETGYDSSAPIFIVGLPRAGSTLIEQILASHSMIEGTSELPNILALARQLAGRYKTDNHYPENLASIAPEQFTQWGEAFIKDTQIHRNDNTPMFIDKMPNNFRHLGLIKKILPNAKIIDARREPVACCFSGFKQLFAEGQEFSYRLTDIRQYYDDYVTLMAHWETCFGDNILRVQHEELVDDLEGQVRRMLTFLEVPFEHACLDFHKTKRNVKTPSAEQVRQPINPNAQHQWQHFAPYLTALTEHFQSD
ncbi:MAG: Beta-barrel assembly-enhancing protease [Glaciecola sp. HTCC2999]|jgi:tetratricopeptide (TPR) repeat protein|nr:MAG: Beta-barrel assembly-enhancing protease [Glaciecola sp. HTCC2999]